ncbi:hypothetical protein C9I98_15140 [Photobacterium sanctipauli]|uniref:DNA repair protein n=1 Tax=Photobacterium sanctipauli TaxID=1342794 RepID=A0A2T3NRD9_9GAMM|nr:hypothetical protein [Photobacterium sanctipauli]PSW18802.1 hypothetical protein C9I98_15140 [Photobacterium sanctipauli]
MKKELKITALAAAIILSGCASDSDSTASLPLETNHSETAIQTDNLVQSIESAEQSIAGAKDIELSWFATSAMRDAQEALKEAKEYYSVFELDPAKANSSSGFFSSKTNIQAAEDAVNQFNLHFAKANKIRQQSLSVLDEAFSYRHQLTEIEAAKHYPNTAKQLESELKRLVNYVADDKPERATKAQPALVTKQRALEVKTVTKIYLSPAQKELARLKKANVALHAPETLASASATLTAAEAFIASEPRATAKIKDKADEAMFSLKHAGNISDVVKKLKAMPEKDYERHVLSFERMLLNISLALGAQDMRDQPIGTHGKNLVAYIKQQRQDVGNEQQLIAELNQEIDALSREAEKVASLESQISQLNAEKLAQQQTEVIPAVPVKAAEEKVATEQPTPETQAQTADTDAVES